MDCCAIWRPAQIWFGPDPSIGFNYLGRLGVNTTHHADSWQITDTGPLLSNPATAVPMQLMHTVDLNAVTIDTQAGPQLHAHWTWGPSSGLDEAQIRRVNQLWFDALTGICAHIRRGGGGLTPSDVALSRLDQHQIDVLEKQYQIADIVPLTPLQQGLLFHTHHDPDHQQGSTDAYLVQINIGLGGWVDSDHLHQATANRPQPPPPPGGPIHPQRYRPAGAGDP